MIIVFKRRMKSIHLSQLAVDDFNHTVIINVTFRGSEPLDCRSSSLPIDRVTV